MNETFPLLFNYIIDFINLAFAEASIIAFVVGLVFFLLGFIVIALTIFVWITGQRVTGKIVGAIKNIRIKEKMRDGKVKKKRKETLYAIFEYRRPDGSVHQERSSNGGSSTLKYKTGQEVSLIIVPGAEYDDAYDANDRTSLVIGGLFLLIGFGVMFQAANFYATLGISTLAFLGLIGMLAFKLLSEKSNKRKNKKAGQAKSSKHHKHFDVADVRPVETFLEEARRTD